MNTGTVKFFKKDKGFGFIIDDETKKEIFVHKSGLVDEIEADDKVKFDTEKGKKGLNCVNVELV